MTEGLAAQISSIVRQHLADAHRMLGTLLAQLDAAAEVDLGGRAATRELAKPAIAAPSLKPSTIERRVRLVRAKQRQANGQAKPQPSESAADQPDSTGWPELRSEFQARIRAQHPPRSRAAAELGVSKGSIAGWLLPNSPPPASINVDKIRAWLTKSAPPPELGPVEVEAVTESAPHPLAAYAGGGRLSEAERDRLADYIGLLDDKGIRDELGMTRSLAGQVVAGSAVPQEALERVRALLQANSNGADAG